MAEDEKKTGLFSWNELVTTDVESAKSFYGSLLGWEFEEMPTPGPRYSLIKVGDKMVGGIAPRPEGAAAMPPVWGPYVTVDDVDKVAGQAPALGGKVLAEPHDLPDGLRIAVIQDAQGASLAVITYTGKNNM